MERTDEAIALFKKQYGKTPEELNFPVIDIYEKQHAFLYAASEEVISAYKTHQNILRFVLTRFLWPLAVAMIIWLVALGMYQDPWHPLALALYAFYVVYMVFFAVLYVKVKKADKLIRLGQNITFLNYGR